MRNNKCKLIIMTFNVLVAINFEGNASVENGN